jgi:hypothetical protein
MPLGQAFVIAFGVVLAVFGFLLVAWRSTRSDRTAIFLRALLNVLSVILLVGIGAFFCWVGKPNLLVGAGMGMAAYASAFRTGFMGWHDYLGRAPSHPTLRVMFRFHFLGNVVASCLCGIGCLTYGGAVGVLGASASGCLAALHLSLLRRVTRETANTEGAS